jgi:hypothetical protein
MATELSIVIRFPLIRKYGEELLQKLENIGRSKETAMKRMVYSLLHSTFKRRSGKLRSSVDIDFTKSISSGSGSSSGTFVPRISFDLNKAPHAASLISIGPFTIRSSKAMAVPMPGSEADKMLSPAISKFGELKFYKSKGTLYAKRPRGNKPLFVFKKSVTIKQTLSPLEIRKGLLNIWNPIVDREIQKILSKRES